MQKKYNEFHCIFVCNVTLLFLELMQPFGCDVVLWNTIELNNSAFFNGKLWMIGNELFKAKSQILYKITQIFYNFRQIFFEHKTIMYVLCMFFFEYVRCNRHKLYVVFVMILRLHFFLKKDSYLRQYCISMLMIIGRYIIRKMLMRNKLVLNKKRNISLCKELMNKLIIC
jgi:hypothetical protein